MKKILLCIFFLCILKAAFPQDFTFGDLTPDELNLKKYDRDSTASAVVLKEFGKSRISDQDDIPLIFNYHVKIKILNNKGLNQAEVVIPIYKSDKERFEKVTDIVASCFYPDQNNNFQEAKLDIKKIYTENKNQYWDLVKFVIPNAQPGSIIEYSYQITSPFLFTFRKWEFQQDIPKIYSEYEAHIPGVYNYNVSLKGALQLSEKPAAELERECFNYHGFKCDCSKITYKMANIPAFVEEDYMTSASNFKSAINFELSDYTTYTGANIKVTKQWKDIDLDLKRDPYFGTQIRRDELFKNQLPVILAKSTDDLSKAKAIYSYIQNTFKWNNLRGFGSDKGIKKALEQHTGTVGDINLSLIAALNAAGLNADAVLLSTRQNGIVNKLYPVVSDFDYVVAKVSIGDKDYLLDATDPLLPFGLLPLRCINDQGRVICFDKPSYWIDLTASQKESKIYSLNLTMQDDGKITGDISLISRGYAAFDKRKAIKKFNSVEEFVENQDEQMPKTRILKSEINNLDSLDFPLIEKYQVEINAYNNLDKEKILFNPFMFEKIKENPFKLAERTYPVDMGAPSETKVILNMKFPADFEILAKPENTGLALPANGGRFISTFESSNNLLIFSQLTDLTRSVYSSAEYPYLKELFNKMVQFEKTDIIFKKKL